MVDHAWRVANPFEGSTHPGSDDPLDREQGHLGVVGDCSDTTVRLVEIANAARTVLGLDLIKGHELDRCAKRIAACST